MSEAAPETIRRAATVHPIAALQSEYSIWERDVEAEILPACRENGVGFVPYSPLGRGFLTGTIRSPDDLGPTDWRRRDPRYSAENFPKNLAVVDVIGAAAARHSASNAQVALAWLLAQGDDIVPIPGVKRLETMRDSAKSSELVLDDEDLARLAAAAPVDSTAGPRYAAAGMASVKR